MLNYFAILNLPQYGYLSCFIKWGFLSELFGYININQDSLYQTVLFADREGVLSALLQSPSLLAHQLLLLLDELHVLVPEVNWKVLQHPPVLHQIQSLRSAIGVPSLWEIYHYRHVLMKSVKSSSGSSMALERVLEAGGAFLSCGFNALSLSKNTCHLLAFYLQYPQMYQHHVLRRHS